MNAQPVTEKAAKVDEAMGALGAIFRDASARARRVLEGLPAKERRAVVDRVTELATDPVMVQAVRAAFYSPPPRVVRQLLTS